MNPDRGPASTETSETAADGAGVAEASTAPADGGGGEAGRRRGFFAGVPRPLLALGVVALVFVVVATVVSIGYGKSSSSSKPLSQSQIKRLLGGQAVGGPPIGFHRLDRKAPTFTLPPVIGSTPVNLAKLTGKPLVVNFWYSTCPPCQKEAPALAAVAKATKGRVTFVGVDYEDSRSSAAAFIRSHHEHYPDGFDANGKVATSVFGISGTPTTYFLSPNGRRELGVQVGAVTEPALVHDLHSLYGVKA